jgi:autotransporter-associated beta strand protein
MCICLPLYAGSAIWLQGPTNGDWNEQNNWMPATIPNGATDVATFGNSSVTSLQISSNSDEEISAIVFGTGADAFTITAVEVPGTNSYVLVLGGSGITNNSGIIQNFVTNSSFDGHGEFSFAGNATAGNSTRFTNNGSRFETEDQLTAAMAFYDTSTAGGAIIVNNPAVGTGLATPGFIYFDNNATAGSATITNNGGGFDCLGATTNFLGNSTAGQASLVNNGGTDTTKHWSNVGLTSFYNASTAANATVANNGGLANPSQGGALAFVNNSTAGNGTFVSNPGQVSGASGGSVDFGDSASASNCTVTSNGSSLDGAFAGRVRFHDTSTAGNSTLRNTGGTVTGVIGGGAFFMDNSTAGSATVIAEGGISGGQGGGIHFAANATGATARVVLSGNGFLRIDAHNAPGVTIGSLEGSGNVFLENNNLTLGSRNNSTVFSGVIQDGGSLTKIGAGTLTLSGANTYAGPTTINAGKLIVNGSVMGAVAINRGGALGGSGAAGSVTVNNGGTAAPSGSQTLHINGNYTQNAGGVLKIEVAGADPSASGLLDITGSATIDGTLEVRFVNGFLPVSGQIFKLMNVAGAFAGSFAQINFPDLRAGFQFQAEFVQGSYQIAALNDGVAATGFLNISTRMQVGTGDNALIGGFIVTGAPATGSGPSGASKKVIIRAIGPSLAPLPGRLADPTLELRDSGGGLIFSNDNWMEGTQAQEIIDSGIPPSDEHEAAIVATLAPGSYTALMRGVGNTTGIGVVEVYDLATEVSAKLANISSRGFVETGDNVMIGGFIAGNQATHVIVRAIGPSLTQSGVPNALADPTLELHNAQGAVVAFNNDWQETDQAAIEATGEKESAIFATLAPGNYTAIVRGLNDTTGVGLVEVYDLN